MIRYRMFGFWVTSPEGCIEIRLLLRRRRYVPKPSIEIRFLYAEGADVP